MPHYTPLITTIVAALTLAWAFAAMAHRLKLPPLVGYLLAGIAIGPFTPGFVADQNIANELAEIGVILLMFGVGLHFHLHELVAVKRIAIPGAVFQSAVATGLGALVALGFGWGWAAGVVFGLALSVASTVVLARVLALNPEILILVEPTSAVDAHTEAIIAERLVAYRQGKTTIVTTVSPLLLHHADRVAFLSGTSVVAYGTHEELLRSHSGYRGVVARALDAETGEAGDD